MSLLSVIQDHCKLYALNVPTSVTGSSDTTVSQLYAIVREVVEELVTESKFNVTTREATFTALAASDQGLLTSLATSGFQWILNGTLWDRTNDLPLFGPVDEVEWQKLQALSNAGPNYSYRVRLGHLYLYPAPAAPLPTIAFEYASSWAVTDNVGAAKAALSADTDLFLFPEILIKKGLAWRWKHIKGLPYLEDQTAYYNLMNNYIAKDGTKKTVRVDGEPDRSASPQIVVPSSNWLQ